MAISTVYKIKNLISGKCYIGSTCDFERRIKQHFALLRRGIHHSLHLQRAYTKHGLEAFLYGIVEEQKIEELTTAEQKFIDLYKPEYNIHLLANKPGEKRKPVLQYTLDGELVKEWSHAAAAADGIGVGVAAIKMVCWGKQHASHGFYWCFKDGEAEKKIQVPLPKAWVRKKKHSRTVPSHKREELQQLSIDGKVLNIWPSMRQAALELGYNPGAISGAITKNAGRYKGFQWQYTND